MFHYGSFRELQEQHEYEEEVEAECTRLELDVRQLTASMAELKTALAQAQEDKAGAETRRVWCIHFLPPPFLSRLIKAGHQVVAEEAVADIPNFGHARKSSVAQGTEA